MAENPFPYARYAAYADVVDTVDTAAEIEALIAPARTTWAAAGGAAPAFGAANLGGGAEAIGLGTTGKVQLSNFNQIGKECFGRLRIVGGTGSTGATGGWLITGWPVLPNPGPAQSGYEIGHGILLDAADSYRQYEVSLVVDAALGDNPILTIANDALGARTAYGDGSVYVKDDTPFEWTDGCTCNIVFQYEGV